MIDIIAEIFKHNQNVGFEDDDEGVENRYSKHTQLVVAVTQSDSIQCLNFAKKNDSFNI